MTRDEAIARYGTIGDGKWADEAKWCTFVRVPDEITWINPATAKRARRIYCNTDIAGPLSAALENVVARALESELKTLDGCFQIRSVRGSSALSTHAYALAVDINAAENGLGAEPKLSPELVKCFTDEGFAWGGTFHRKDGMHFSYAWEG